MQIAQSDFSAGKELFCRRTEWYGKEKRQRLPEKAILMDVRMPVMDGYETTRAVRGLGRKDADIPIIRP